MTNASHLTFFLLPSSPQQTRGRHAEGSTCVAKPYYEDPYAINSTEMVLTGIELVTFKYGSHAILTQSPLSGRYKYLSFFE